MLPLALYSALYRPWINTRRCECSELLQSLTVLQGIMALPGKAFSEACLLCAVSLRMQVDPSSTEFKSLLLERAYADVIFCGCLLFLIVWNFMG